MSTADAANGNGDSWADFDDQLVIEVRNRFDGSWSHGFEIVERLDVDGAAPRLRLRRLSDGHVLPALFSADDIVVNPTPRRL
ncbi:MAG TPA: hypothetical protein VHD87_02460 [Acidimicrobiales bacterium]|nr:hypothetical protein [Acidimicrobiales bacterium]